MGKNLKGKELGKNLRQRKDGRYEATYTDNFGKRHSIYGTKLNDVRQRLNDALYDKSHNIYSPDYDMTLNEWYDVYVKEYYSKKVSVKTLYNQTQRYNSAVRQSKLGQMKIKDIRNLHVQNFVNELIRDKPDLKKGTVQAYISPITSALRQAVICDYIPTNPVHDIIIPKTSKKVKTIITQEQQELLLRYTRNPIYRGLYQFLLLTGLRAGEAFALTWSDIDFEHRIISVTKSVSRMTDKCKKTGKNLGYKVDNNINVLFPKTKTSIRDVPMCNDCYELLSDMFNKRDKNINLIFYNRDHTYISNITMDMDLEYTCKVIQRETGYEMPHISLHCFRHTFATRCFEKGISAKTVQVILGHSDISTTLNVYTHVSRNFTSSEINKISL